MKCPCGCGRDVKPGNTYAAKSCGRIAMLLRKRGVLPPEEKGPTPMCAECGVLPVKWKRGRWMTCCDRTCAAVRAQRLVPTEVRRRVVWALQVQKMHTYAARARQRVEAACARVAKDRETFTKYDLVEIAMTVYEDGYNSGYRTAYMRGKREKEAAA